MDDDKRAEAMRRAIAESDAAKAKESKSKVKSISKGSVDIVGLAKKYFGIAKDKVLEMWQLKVGKIGIIAAGVVILLLIVSSAFSSGTVKEQGVKPSYTISDQGLAVYADVDAPSGYAYDAFIEITNTGDKNLYIGDDIMFLVQDTSGSRICLDSNIVVCPAIIAPGSKGYMFNQFGTDCKDGTPTVGQKLQMQPKFVISKSDGDVHRYPVSDVNITDNGVFGKSLTCEVTNDTDNTVSAMRAVVVLYDANGHCIGISSSFLNNVAARSRVPLKFDKLSIMAGHESDAIADYAVFVS